MDQQDKTAAILAGFTAFIKFNDGEILPITVHKDTADDWTEWFSDVESFINGRYDFFPLGGIAVNRHIIKYVAKL